MQPKTEIRRTWGALGKACERAKSWNEMMRDPEASGKMKMEPRAPENPTCNDLQLYGSYLCTNDEVLPTKLGASGVTDNPHMQL